jgi:hypothetical protein
MILRTQVAKSTPFDNATNSFTSTEVQSAIEEAKATAQGKARFAIQCGFDGTASTGRWLEFSANSPSDGTPFTAPRALYLRETSLTAANNATTTITIYKNIKTTPVSITTISLSGSSSASVTGLSISLPQNETVGVKVTSGSSSKPMVFLFFEVQ